METQEKVQKRIDLTPAQKKAWTQFVRAVNRCKKEGIYFYQVLEHVGGLNGKNVSHIENIEYTKHDSAGPRNLNYLSYPDVDITGAFADDTHAVIFKND